MGKIKQIKTRVEERLMEIYSKIGIIGGKPQNHKDVVTCAMNGIMEIIAIESDVDKAFDKWMKNKELFGFHNNMQVLLKVFKPDFGKLDTGMLPPYNLQNEGLVIPQFARKATPNITGFNSHIVENNIWSEIRNNYEEDSVVYIDAWEDENDDSDGRVIAKIDKFTRKVEYIDKRAKTDKYAQEVIAEALLHMMNEDETIELDYSCDMGSLKIGTDDLSLFINNGFGNGKFKVRIILNKTEPTNEMKFEGHFTVRNPFRAGNPGNVRIFRHDCELDVIYTFTKTGRYFYYTDKGNIHIIWNDNVIDS